MSVVEKLKKSMTIFYTETRVYIHFRSGIRRLTKEQTNKKTGKQKQHHQQQQCKNNVTT